MDHITVGVVVNHGTRRRGDRFDTAATDDILALIQAGYLQPLGPAAPPPAWAPPEVVVIHPPRSSGWRSRTS